VGAVWGIHPTTGHHDDTKRYIDAACIGAVDRKKIFEDNARRVYARMKLPA